MPGLIADATRIWEVNLYWPLHAQCGVWDPKGKGVDVWECIRPHQSTPGTQPLLAIRRAQMIVLSASMRPLHHLLRSSISRPATRHRQRFIRHPPSPHKPPPMPSSRDHVDKAPSLPLAGCSPLFPASASTHYSHSDTPPPRETRTLSRASLALDPARVGRLA
ncbi:hypothetical protein C8Q77DRAFT_1205021 [Trametes polyzona]|nr:hypothetical protein C8Q77DRAFT_1205021 [Trametes polyzona]